VRDAELFQPERALAAARQLVGRRRAHSSDADDDRIEDLIGHDPLSHLLSTLHE
jgi:hypothetical protein